MKKVFSYLFILFFACISIFGSCEEDMEKRAKARDKAKVYFKEYKLYEPIDSTFTGITVLFGEVDGHKYKYTLYTGKYKSNLIETHLVSECRKCKAVKK